jgi:hypothetical protein
MVGLLELEMGLGELLIEHVQAATLLPLWVQALAKPPHPHGRTLCRCAAVAMEETGRAALAGPYHQQTDGSSRRCRRWTWRCRARPDIVVLDAGRQARR